RLRPGMLESTTQPCAHCHGTGLIRSDDSLALQILRALEEEGTRKRSKEVLLKAPVAVINFLVNNKREHIALIEARYGMSVRIEADPHLISPDYVIEKFKTATRVVPEPSMSVISGNAGLMGAAVDEYDDIVDEDIVDVEDEAEEAPVVAARAEPRAEPRAEGEGDGNGGKKKRRRRRRRKGGTGNGEAGQSAGSDEEGDDEDGDDDEADAGDDAVVAVTPAEAEVVAETEAPKKTRTVSRSSKSKPATAASGDKPAPKAPAKPAPKAAAKPSAKSAKAAEATPVAVVETVDAEAPAKPKTTRSRKPKAEPVVVEAAVEVAAPAPAQVETPAPVLVADPGPTVAASPVVDPSEAEAVADDNKPKRKGWWSLGR
ncbi:MAG: ribonuclease E/G, partial [Paracoccaceae bacterium]